MSYLYTPREGRLWLRFNPSDYGVTPKIVENVHTAGNVTRMADGCVIVEYREPAQIVSLFFMLELHIVTPEDYEVPPTPTEARLRRHNEIAETIVVIGGPLLAVLTVIYTLIRFIFFE